MIRADKLVKDITAKVGDHFRTFGGDKVPIFGNPIAEALRGKPLQFAAGVDVEEVVTMIATEILMELLKYEQEKERQ